MDGLSSILARSKQDPTFLSLCQAIKKKTKNLSMVQVNQAMKPYLIHALSQELSRDLVVIFASDELQVRWWQDKCAEYKKTTLVFRPREYDYMGSDAVNRAVEQERIRILSGLLAGEPMVLIVHVGACHQMLPPAETFLKDSLTFKEGECLDLNKLADQLVELGYERTALVEGRGEFSIRGDILDIGAIYCPDLGADQGLRILLFDTEIDEIKRFSFDSQRTIDAIKNPVHMTPAKEVLVPSVTRHDFIARVEKAELEALKGLGTDQHTLLLQRHQNTIQKLKDGRHSAPIDRWLFYLWQSHTTIFSYLALACQIQTALVFFDEEPRIRYAIKTEYEDRQALITEGMLKGYWSKTLSTMEPNIEDLWLEFEKKVCTIKVSNIGGEEQNSFVFSSQEHPGIQGGMSQILLQIKEDLAPHLCLCVADSKQKELLQAEIVQDRIQKDIKIWEGSIENGFYYKQAHFSLYGIQDLFGSKNKRKRYKKKNQKKIFFGDIQVGDIIVHEDYGIGIYKGLESIQKDSGVKEYIRLIYANGDELFLPVEQIDLIKKYIGTDSAPPRLSRLNGKEWDRLKEKSKQSIQKLAIDLVALYSIRLNTKGFACQPKTDLEVDFELGFPYEETEDQNRTINEISQDMESDQVMDRLLCGDVGYGKTEVAFRALIKAVANGKQAALVVPTTILAQQHYENLLERVQKLPIKIRLLNRYISKAEQKLTITGIENGDIDILIGTHRIFSKDILFKDLGLIVIDEEQRFGVEHKERLKEKYVQADVLSLSATPIPRTLHMALSGIRDISVIEEAPADRRPVMTQVREYADDMVARAIMRELNRRGQVFYLFNNTHKIEEKVAHLQDLLPGVRFSFAHGKMQDRELEDALDEFLTQKTDVLVCTTIIESGIDMPNVNTIIVEQADRLGLSQLYQLRGRVGRSERQAYAYMTYKRNHLLTETAEKRLSAIRDFTELGSGFKIAMRDLEVRGAGNLIGPQQHGQLNAIGYELYARLLEEAVQEIKKPEAFLNKQESIDTNIDIPVDAHVPSEYIQDESQRIDVYQRLMYLNTKSDYEAYLDELSDRYGMYPQALETLGRVNYIRKAAGKLGVEKIFRKDKFLILKFSTTTSLDLEKITQLLHSDPKRLHLDVGQAPYLSLRIGDIENEMGLNILFDLLSEQETGVSTAK